MSARPQSFTGEALPAALGNAANGPPAHEHLATEYLRARGLTPEIAQRAGIYPVANAQEVHLGFKRAPGLILPYHDPWSGSQVMCPTRNGKSPFVRTRYLVETGVAKSFVPTANSQRFAQIPGTPAFAYFAPGGFVDWPSALSDARRHLVLTEGEIKALSACANGIATIALGGVFNFIRDDVLLPELEQINWAGRHAFFVYDSDVVAKPDVQAAERRLGAELIQRGAIVHFARLPRVPGFEKTGLDDLLRVKGDDALLKLLESTPSADPGTSLIVEGTDVEIADSVLGDLADKHRSQVVFCEGEFYVYVDTHWRALPDDKLRNAVFRYDKTRFKKGAAGIVKLSKSRADSVLSIMRDRAMDRDFFARAPAGINCASGFITFDADGRPAVEAHDRNHRQRHCLPGSWEPDASWRDARLIGMFLKGCFAEDSDFDEKIALVSEICGVAALGIGTRMTTPKAVAAFGPTAENGKSEMLAMVRGLLPGDAVCAVPPTRFGDERMLIKLVGKVLNACDELGTTHAISSDTFKSVVTGDPVMGKELYKPAVSFTPTALNIYATNVLPPFHGGFDRGVQRRLLVLPFNRSIPRSEQISELGKRIAAEEMDALLAFAVKGATRVIRTGQFTEPESCRATLREWVFTADPVLAWLVDRAEYVEGHRSPVKQVYADFKEWAESEGVRADRLPSAQTFVGRLFAQDGRLGKARDSMARYIVGLKVQTTQTRWAASAVSQRDDTAARTTAPPQTPRWGGGWADDAE